jgi:hypothetical protein
MVSLVCAFIIQSEYNNHRFIEYLLSIGYSRCDLKWEFKSDIKPLIQLWGFVKIRSLALENM